MEDILTEVATPASSLIITPSDVEHYAPSMKTVNLGVPVRDDWSEYPIIGDFYEMYLQAVQRSTSLDAQVARFARKPIVAYDRNTTFESFLGDCLDTTRWRIEVELEREYYMGYIDATVRENGKMLAEAVIGEIRKYLEGTPKERLMGVPEPM